MAGGHGGRRTELGRVDINARGFLSPKFRGRTSAQAAFRTLWIPAFAGMTVKNRRRWRDNPCFSILCALRAFASNSLCQHALITRNQVQIAASGSLLPLWEKARVRALRAQARLCGRDARAPRGALTYRARKRPNRVRRLLDSRFRGNDGVSERE